MSLIGEAMGVFGQGAQILGPLIEHEEREDQFDANLAWQKEQLSRQEALQREFAQHGVRWRVEDAKAAGVHPLFALGGSGAAYSPSGIVSMGEDASLGKALSESGQALSRAVAAQETDEQRLQRQLAIEGQLAQITKDYAQASYWQSEAARNRQQKNPAMPNPAIQTQPFVRGSVDAAKIEDIVQMKPDEFISPRSDDPSVTAGTHSGMQEHVVTPYGLRMRLPRSDEGPSEAWGELSWYDKAGLILHNMNYYGEGWGGRFLREFLFGEAPKFRSWDPSLRGSSMEAPSYRSRGGRSTGGYQRR